jgi:hypothetical protein
MERRSRTTQSDHSQSHLLGRPPGYRSRAVGLLRPFAGDGSMSTPDTDETWRDGIDRVGEEAAGVLHVRIIDALAGSELLVRALSGDPEAMVMLRAVDEAEMQVTQAPRKQPALCVACPRAVRRINRGTVFGVLVPVVPFPTTALGFVFCEKCAAAPAALMAKAAKGLRRIWPDLRPITITDPIGGRA